LDPSNVNGVVAASTGNHAAAVAYALEKKGIRGVIFLPDNVSRTKVDKLKYYEGVELKYHGSDSVQTEKEAKKYAEEQEMVYISPYNDPEIIAGQGTIGHEISQQLENIDSVFVPVGGGGLISGIAGYLKHENQGIEVIGCQPENSAVMYHSVNAGRILDLPSLPTISDGTAGGVEENSLTYQFCDELVDSWILLTESEILESLRLLMRNHNMVVEGSAGLALAALIKNKERYADKTVVLILCGSKFNDELLKQILENG
jgi:threonine dehydratase